ncbi:hypothetical protein [uncultured Mailhella sp.]|uniref:hypothetical protein n=1 Tax=uncultured Mailhella sp. TaxID=1981031 RepID=UPI0025F9A732|nr:hypothetical protein [uncultured Mailhella sp.]
MLEKMKEEGEFDRGMKPPLLKKGFSPSPRAPHPLSENFYQGGEELIGAIVAVGSSRSDAPGTKACRACEWFRRR